ncbi:MAG: isoaspartyl peptidase/L-asparaginase [Acidobacteria bacterium]|nr:isoaspartyl peptidase/L-asparaginase [Acidobacteriota bacterium]
MLNGEEQQKFSLVLHGGAGTITRESMTPETEAEYRAKLEEALKTGYEILAAGGTSLDAVESTIRVMEDSPLFNAGKGAVFTHDGRNELDASIMDGKTRQAGAVASVTIIRNPISAARAVMEKSPHVMMTGDGANLFATSVGLEVVDPSYFWTERRWKQLQERLMKQHDFGSEFKPAAESNDDKKGTVGVVAVDQHGNIAAGTSTGGMTDKRFGRVGDSPIIGAGTYADNATCGVSGTGEGEYFIRLGVARDVAALMEYKDLSVAEASRKVIAKLTDLGGTGGVIAMDRNGNIAMEFNTEGMYRGWIRENGTPHVEIYGD